MISLVAGTGSKANLARYLPPSVVSTAIRFAGIGPVETPPLSKRIMQGRSVTGLTSMITAAPLALTLTRLTRCEPVSVPLAQLSLVSMLGKMNQPFEGGLTISQPLDPQVVTRWLPEIRIWFKSGSNLFVVLSLDRQV